MVAPSRVGTTTHNSSESSQSSISFSHTCDTGTELLIVKFQMRATESISGTPTFNGDNLTLIRDTGSGGVQTPRIYVYGRVNPDITTGTVSATLDSGAAPRCWSASNWQDVDTTSVAAATNFIDDTVNTSGSSTVLASGGSDGNILLAFGGFRGADGDPVGWSSATFNEDFEESSGTSNSNSQICAEADYDTLPSGTTIGWSASDDNAGVLIEIVAAPGADVDITVPQGNLALTTAAPTAIHPAWLRQTAYRFRNDDGTKQAP